MPGSPAFQFYPDDFLGSGKVGVMTLREIGAYTMLLCLDWNEVGFLYDEEELARWCRCTRKEFRTMWPRLSRCFVERDGRLYNPRLEVEREKQREWREKSVKGGKAGAKKRWGDKGAVTTPITTPITNGMTTGQPNDDTPVSSLQSPVTTTATTCVADAPRLRRPRRKEPSPDRPSSRPSWLTPVAAAWEEAKGAGSFPWPKAGALLKPLHEAGHTGEVIADYLRRYVAAAGEYVSLARFRETFGDYAPTPVVPLVDEFGCLTEAGERATRPAGVRGVA